MGNHNSGRKKQETCQRGHDLNKPENVIIIKRKTGKTERMCRPCQNERQRQYWRRKHAKGTEG